MKFVVFRHKKDRDKYIANSFLTRPYGILTGRCPYLYYEDIVRMLPSLIKQRPLLKNFEIKEVTLLIKENQ